jgi:UDP-glucose 4-epimerase
MDLSEGHLAALKYLQQQPGCHAFNLGSGCGYSILEVIRVFEKACGKEVPFKFVPKRQGDICESRANPQKAKDLLKWETTRTLADMCKTAWDFQNLSSFM